MFENITRFFRRIGKKEQEQISSSDAAKERLHLVLMQDRANVSADFLEIMKQEIIEVIKKYIDVDEKEIDVRLTNKTNEDGTTGAPALYANIPISGIKQEKTAKKEEDKKKEKTEKEVEDPKSEEPKKREEKAEDVKEIKVEEKNEVANATDKEVVQQSKEVTEGVKEEEKIEGEAKVEDSSKNKEEVKEEKEENSKNEQKQRVSTKK